MRWHAPSVQTSTSPGAACGRWPGSDLDRRRGLTAIWRDSTTPGTRKAARRATPDAVLPATHPLTRSQLTQRARGALHMQTRTFCTPPRGPCFRRNPEALGPLAFGRVQKRVRNASARRWPGVACATAVGRPRSAACLVRVQLGGASRASPLPLADWKHHRVPPFSRSRNLAPSGVSLACSLPELSQAATRPAR